MYPVMNFFFSNCTIIGKRKMTGSEKNGIDFSAPLTFSWQTGGTLNKIKRCDEIMMNYTGVVATCSSSSSSFVSF